VEPFVWIVGKRTVDEDDGKVHWLVTGSSTVPCPHVMLTAVAHVEKKRKSRHLIVADSSSASKTFVQAKFSPLIISQEMRLFVFIFPISIFVLSYLCVTSLACPVMKEPIPSAILSFMSSLSLKVSQSRWPVS
jgi:hypothetical protein